VREVIRRNLIRTEIIADSSDIITIQVLITLPELSVNTAVRRMFLIATSMHKDAMSSLSEMNHELARAVIKSDDEVDRFSLYVLRNLVMASQNERTLREIGLKKASDCLSYRVAVKSIERIADHSSGIADKCLKIEEEAATKQQKMSKDLFEKIDKMSQSSLTVFNDSVEAFLRRDYIMADSVVEKTENIRSQENDIISSLNKGENKSISYEHINSYIRLILEDIRRIAEYASDIAEAAMNQTIGEVIIVEKRPPAVVAATSALDK
jgi:phosphate uptake regulator